MKGVVYVSLAKGIAGLLLERSSNTMQGIFVAPEVIDRDFEGQIEVMTHSSNPISVVKTGHRLAQ